MATQATCPYCNASVERRASEAEKCPECEAWHHADCWLENGGCAVVGCTAVLKPKTGRRLIVTADDLEEDGDSGERAGWASDTSARLAIGAAILILVAGVFAFVVKTVTDAPEQPDVRKILDTGP